MPMNAAFKPLVTITLHYMVLATAAAAKKHSLLPQWAFLFVLLTALTAVSSCHNANAMDLYPQ
jgi:hypothetical protein